MVFPYLKPLTEYKQYERLQFDDINKVVDEMNLPSIKLCDLYLRLIKQNFTVRGDEADDIILPKSCIRLLREKYMSISKRIGLLINIMAGLVLGLKQDN